MISPSQRPLPDNTQHSQQTSMPRVGFEPTIVAGERSYTYALDRASNVDIFCLGISPKLSNKKRKYGVWIRLRPFVRCDCTPGRWKANTESWWKCSWQGKTAVFPLSRCPQQIPHGSSCSWTRTYAVWSFRLPRWAAVITKEKYIERKCRHLLIYTNNRLNITCF